MNSKKPPPGKCFAWLLSLSLLSGAGGLANVAFAADVRPVMGLTGPGGTLTADSQGISIAPRDAACPTVSAAGAPLWTIVIQKVSTTKAAAEEITLSSAGQQPRREETPQRIRLVYDSLGDGKQTWKLGLTLNIYRQADAFAIDGELRNDADGWIVASVTGPVLSGIQADLTTHPLYWPCGFGERISAIATATLAAGKYSSRQTGWRQVDRLQELEAAYPGPACTMPWCTFAGKQGGLYFGSHDPAHAAKFLRVQWNAATHRFAAACRYQPYCRSGQRWTLPPLVIRPYRGSWHVAAQTYRAWYDSVTPLRAAPQWVRDSSGWLLCILKQQNGEVLWDYPSLPKLAEVADQRGLDILGLFGWTEAGHDHLYPVYVADPRMGGVDGFRRALVEVHRRCKRAILYANGQLIAQSTEFWNTQGKDLAIVGADGRCVEQTWQKYQSFPAQRFGVACLSTQAWYDRMLALAHQANSLGADGILYDQLGMSNPMPCFATNHGHAVPAVTHAEDRHKLLRRIADEMAVVNPNFIVMTEGMHDSVFDAVALFHGCVLGLFAPTPAEMLARMRPETPRVPFPEMLRFTFPEVMSTVRHPTPMMDRMLANFACTYGLRYEIESRYAPDVRYFQEGLVPTREDYRDVLNPPNVALMRATPCAEAAGYLKRVIDLQRRYADLLWHARFVDDEGFEFYGVNLVAKGYASGRRLAALVWNPTDKAASFSLAVPQAKLLLAAEPEQEQVAPLSPLPAQTVRLLVWEMEKPPCVPAH